MQTSTESLWQLGTFHTSLSNTRDSDKSSYRQDEVQHRVCAILDSIEIHFAKHFTVICRCCSHTQGYIQVRMVALAFKSRGNLLTRCSRTICVSRRIYLEDSILMKHAWSYMCDLKSMMRSSSRLELELTEGARNARCKRPLCSWDAFRHGKDCFSSLVDCGISDVLPGTQKAHILLASVLHCVFAGFG